MTVCIDLDVNSDHCLRVHLWPTPETMHEVVRASVGCDAYYTSVPYRWSNKGPMFPEVCGHIHVPEKHVGGGVFAHELQHFILDWARAHRMLERQCDEKLCKLVGELTSQFWRKYYERGTRWNGEHCQRCGWGYASVWMAPDDVWAEVTGNENGSGLYCMPCFDKMAREKNIYLHWGCGAEEYPLETELLALETHSIELDELLRRMRLSNEHLEVVCTKLKSG